ncbi:hypothetical protein SLA2020_239710 [Shorea laevis]
MDMNYEACQLTFPINVWFCHRWRECSAGTIAILCLLTTAFSPSQQYSIPSLPLNSFMLFNYCVMMMLCTMALVVDVSHRIIGPNSYARHCREILQTIIVLTGSLAVISLLSISNPDVAFVSLLVWLLLAVSRLNQIHTAHYHQYNIHIFEYNIQFVQCTNQFLQCRT